MFENQLGSTLITVSESVGRGLGMCIFNKISSGGAAAVKKVNTKKQ